MKGILRATAITVLAVMSIPNEGRGQWNSLLINDTMNYRAVQTVDRDRAWFVGFSGTNSTVQFTPDGGQSFGGGYLTNGLLFDLAITGSSSLFVVGQSLDCNCGLMAKSTDGGVSWRTYNFENIFTIYDVTFVSPSVGFMSGTGGLIVGTTDGGESWSIAMEEGDDVILDVNFPSTQTGYAVAGADNDFVNGSRLYRTRSGGEKWDLIFDGAEDDITLSQAAFATETHGLMVGDRNGPAVWITTDRGESWSEVLHLDDPSARFRSVTFVGTDTAFAAGDGAIVYSSFDGGYTWQQERTLIDAPIYDISFSDGVGWAVATGGIRYKTVRPVGPEGYCIPPVTGPVYGSGITSVSLDASPEINRNSRGNELYSWHADVESVPALRRGDQYTVGLSTDPNNIDGHNSSRVWIDFNRDGDFEDENEDVGIWDSHELATTQSVTFTVPLTAVEGETIMRVYTDMPSTFGHDEPRPCGYLSSENVIGHHGEVEDYSVRIVNENAASVAGHGIGSISVAMRAGQIELRGLSSESEVSLIDIEGRVVAGWIAPAGSSAISPGAIVPGTYFVRIDGQGSEEVFVHRIETGRLRR